MSATEFRTSPGASRRRDVIGEERDVAGERGAPLQRSATHSLKRDVTGGEGRGQEMAGERVVMMCIAVPRGT